MQLPPPDSDPLFADLWRDLPDACGWDTSLRETAADCALLYETMTDASLAER